MKRMLSFVTAITLLLVTAFPAYAVETKIDQGELLSYGTSADNENVALEDTFQPQENLDLEGTYTPDVLDARTNTFDCNAELEVCSSATMIDESEYDVADEIVMDLAVFVDGANGNNNNSGLNSASAVLSLDKAYEILLSLNNSALVNDASECGIINICGSVDVGSNFNIDRDFFHSGTVKITSNQGEGVITFSGANEQAIQLGGPTIIENVVLNRASNKAYTVYAPGSLIIGNGVINQCNGVVSNKGVTNDTMQGKCIVRGGFYNAPYTGDVDISISSGTYWFVSGANATANGSVSGNVSITLGGDSWVTTVVPGTQSAASSITTSTIKIIENATINKLVVSGDLGNIVNSNVVISGGTVNELLTTRTGKYGTVTNFNIKVSSSGCPTYIPVEAESRTITFSGVNYTITSGIPWNKVNISNSSMITLEDELASDADISIEHDSILYLPATAAINAWTGCGVVYLGDTLLMNDHVWNTDGACNFCGTNRYTVFVDGNASAGGDGYSKDFPVNSLTSAYQTLLSGEDNLLLTTASSEGQIVVCGDVLIDGEHFNLNGIYEHAGTVKITSVHDSIDYRTTNSAKLRIGSKGTESQIRFQCGGPTVFDEVVLERVNRANGSAGASLTIYATEQLVIGENVETRNTNWVHISALTSEEANAVKLSSHMGYHENAPANSKPAFIQAGQLGYWAIETDVYTTKDGILVCCHDQTIDSMYNGSGRISNMTYQELLQYKIDAGNDVDKYTDEELRIPTFSEYLSICAQYGALPFIEIKSANVEAVINEAKQFFDESDIIISSSNFTHLQQARAASSEVFVHHIFSNESYIDDLAALGNAGMAFNYTYTQLLDPSTYAIAQRLILTAHENNIQVCLRAGDTNEAVKLMLEMGVDYIPTNTSTPVSITESTYESNTGGKIFIRGGYGYKQSTAPINITILSGIFDFVAASNAENACSGDMTITVGGDAFISRLVMGPTYNDSTTVNSSVCTIADTPSIKTIYSVGDYGNVVNTVVNVNGGCIENVHGRRDGKTGTAQNITLSIADEMLVPGSTELNQSYITGTVSILVNGIPVLT